MKNFCTSLTLFVSLSQLIFCLTAAGQTMKIINPSAIPEGIFIFGMYNIETGTIHLGVPNDHVPLGRGFHFEFLRQLSSVNSEGEMINKQRQGKFAGFGFKREGNTIYLHPLSSLKAAGKVNDINTVNPLLPRPNAIWPAVLPKHLAREIFSKLASLSDMPFEIDSDILGSKRFTFNEQKNGPKTGPLAQGMALRGKAATLWLKSLAQEINEEHFKKKLTDCAN